MEAPAVPFRAFISYSHRDTPTVAWLHRALESYRMPAKLVGRASPLGAVPRRLIPIFRDRDELPASGDLGTELRAALARSLILLVVCTPAAARSQWVNEEILSFKRMHGESRVLALVADGEPGTAAIVGREDEECFPPALRFKLGADGELSSEPAAPIAADLRPHADGRRLAFLKLVAGVASVRLDDLIQREAQRHLQRVTVVASAAIAGMVLTGGLAAFANQQRIVAERETAAARAAAEFLVGTFALSNPATENPRTITALTILTRGAERARSELADQPAIQVRLLDTVAKAYNNLGLFRESQAALEPARDTLLRAGPDGAEGLLTLATTYMNQGALPKSMATVTQAEELMGPNTAKFPGLRGEAAEMRARVERAQYKLAASNADYVRALDYYARAPSVKPQILARAYNNRGLTLADLGKYDEARVSLMKGNEIFRRTMGQRHVLTGQSYSSLAKIALKAGRLAESEKEVTQAISILRGVLEDDNPILGDTLSLRGQIFLARDQPAKAAVVLTEAIGVYEKAYHQPHYRTGATQVYRALAESAQGQVQAALADLDRAKVNYDGSYHTIHANHGDLLVNRARILNRAGRRTEAVRDCAAGLEILKRAMGKDDSFYKTSAAFCAGL